MKQFLKALDSVERVICIFLMTVMFIVLFCQTLFRNIHVDAYWTDELGRYLFVLTTYIGSGLAMLWCKHVKIDVMINIWPKVTRPYVELLGSLISIVFCAYLTYATCDYNINTVLAGGRLSASMQIPIGIPYLSVTIGYFLMTVREIQKEFIPLFKKAFHKKSAEPVEEVENK